MTEEAAQQSFCSIPVEEARAKIEAGSIQVADIRPPFDYAGGHIPHSVSLPGLALQDRASQLQGDRELLLVDVDGSRTHDACALAASLGFATVMSLAGGFEAWLAAGYDIHTISDSMAG